ncbi:hypothetical protein [Eremococcus coleocola]|uniref:hypothetical protein n=1 Tax=Eremococcus coleocola TaxID=88132 RepID=UPI0012DF10A5|nr:hypothetical protein [Eremococcus coleocola]
MKKIILALAIIGVTAKAVVKLKPIYDTGTNTMHYPGEHGYAKVYYNQLFRQKL